jgi:RecQ family ATP-dependent DNA helicase
MSADSEELVPGLPLTREAALALPGIRRYRLVEFLVRWEHFGAARELLEALVAEKRGKFFYQYRLSQCYLATGEVDRAKQLAQDLHAAPATRAIGALAVGDVLYVEGRLARAEEQYRQALESEKTRESAQRRLAWCLLHRRNLEGAAELVQQLAAGRPPSRLSPAEVRLMAAVAAATGQSETAAALRRELKSRWGRETEQFRDALELGRRGGETRFEEATGLQPGADPKINTETRSHYVYPTARERRAAEAPTRTRSARPPATGPASIPLRSPASDTRAPELAPAPTSPLHDFLPPPAANHARPAAPSPTPNTQPLNSHLRELFGYEQFRPGQEEVVRHVLAGRSVLAIMPTGQGKSLCFQLPAMLLPRATVVVSPLIALMQDQLEGLPERVRARTTVLNSSLESAEMEGRLRDLAEGRYSLIYVAPERLRQRPFLHALRREGVSLLVVDEAHCISLWGQEFRPDYLFLPRVLADLGSPPLLAMTATATPAIQAEIRSQFGVPMEALSQGVFRPNLHLEVRRCPNKSLKLKALTETCRAEPGALLVYVNARARAEHLAQALNEAGMSAGHYHAGLSHEQRESTQQRFMWGEPRCLVATVAFGMGIDKPDIRLILHFDLPRSLEGYYQEAGRAGRDGQPARCLLFASSGDRGSLSRWAREDRLTVDEVLRVDRTLAAARELTVAHDDLERETRLDETRVRVAISMLERVGALRRHCDLPRVCTLQACSPGDAGFAGFVSDARLRLRQRVTRDTAELSLLTGIAPEALESRLLEWAEIGWLEYRGSARGLRLERLETPDLPARLRELLQTIEAVDEARLERLDAYVRTSGCRHAFLAAYFGQPWLPGGAAAPNPGCGACDNCRAAMVRDPFGDV